MSLSDIIDSIESHLDDAAARASAEDFEQVEEVLRLLHKAASQRMQGCAQRLGGNIQKAAAFENRAETHLDEARMTAEPPSADDDNEDADRGV